MQSPSASQSPIPSGQGPCVEQQPDFSPSPAGSPVGLQAAQAGGEGDGGEGLDEGGGDGGGDGGGGEGGGGIEAHSAVKKRHEAVASL